MDMVIWQLKSLIRYKTLNKLITERDSIITLSAIQPLINLVDKTKFKYLRILIIEL